MAIEDALNAEHLRGIEPAYRQGKIRI